MSPSLIHDLRSVLDGYRPGSPSQTEERNRWLEIAGDPKTLQRSGDPAHFTASALPVDPDRGKVCLILHPLIGAWVQPGGHLEREDDSVMGAAAREMEEETGLTGSLDPSPLLLSRHPAPCGVGDWHLDVQMLAVVSGVRTPISPESLDVRWFSFEALPAETASGVEILVAAARERLSRSATPAPPSPGG